ncbi:PAC2 family protein [Isoptericola sp. b441]|uniref:PAC2 family protein n=1 Tax=Actinotalea lenta TaxID=3064654 RepID=A0ABT9D9H0_9CELL|nr:MULTISPECIES: PAC2 family protein [unclassified Isoptericola]MDO8107552.1 PAC2 family protein [Isoptericola sp. b441]MDO8120788.1 PAC2 family protein [Isoptericola sp. b490]
MTAPQPPDALRGPVMIAAFEGWNDAGSAASQAVVHLHQAWHAEQVEELDPEEYHDFQVNRPQVGLGADGTREITWPTTTLSVAERPSDAGPVVLVHGIEPSMRWRRFCDELLDAAERLGVTTVVTLGALLADVPHTRPIPVTATSDDRGVRAELDLERSSYEGPTGIVGVLTHEASRRGLRTVSMWAAVPHYVAHPPSPKATLALLTRTEELLGETIDMGELHEDAEAWQNGVDELAAEDSEIAEYVAQLEEAKDTVDLPEASGEAIAREFERYLRRRDKPGS